MSTPSEFFTVSRVRDMTGLSVVTLSWLEKELSEVLDVRHTTGGNRLYTRNDIERLQEVKRLLEDEGKSIEEAKAIMFPGRFTAPVPPAPPVPADTVPGLPLAQFMTPPASAGTGDHEADFADACAAALAADDGPAIPRDKTSFSAWTEGSASQTVSDQVAAISPDTPQPEMRETEEPASPTDDPGVQQESEPIPAPLPVEPTLDLLLEATEGLVHENVKLRRAIDQIGHRCSRLEDEIDVLRTRRGGLLGLFRRS